MFVGAEYLADMLETDRFCVKLLLHFSIIYEENSALLFLEHFYCMVISPIHETLINNFIVHGRTRI